MSASKGIADGLAEAWQGAEMPSGDAVRSDHRSPSSLDAPRCARGNQTAKPRHTGGSELASPTPVCRAFGGPLGDRPPLRDTLTGGRPPGGKVPDPALFGGAARIIGRNEAKCRHALVAADRGLPKGSWT